MYSLLGFGSNGPAIRMLNLPTSDAWINPWLAVLSKLSVRLLIGHELTGLDLRGGRIAGAQLQTPQGRTAVSADWYVCALPVERARQLWSAPILAADPSLARMDKLGTAWMNGIQFYLSERPQIVKGGVVCTDSPWAVGFAMQGQLWSVDLASTFGDGRARDCISTIIADWTKPGVLFGKPATECTPQEIAREVWEQMKRHVNKVGQPTRLSDDILLSWSIDQGMIPSGGHLVSDDPLVLPTVGTEQYRPGVGTAIPNLVLAGDYLNGPWEVANMESACFNGRRAANAILDRAGSREPPATVAGPYRPPEWEPAKQVDALRYASGQPNVFDLEGVLPPPVAQLTQSLGLGPVTQSLGLG